MAPAADAGPQTAVPYWCHLLVTEVVESVSRTGSTWPSQPSEGYSCILPARYNPASLSPDNPFQCQGPELSFYQDAVSLYLGLIF